MRQFLDQFVHRELSKLAPVEQDHIGRLNEIEETLKVRKGSQERRGQIETERRDLLARLQKGESVKAALPAWRAAEAANAYVEELLDSATQTSEAVRSLSVEVSALRERLARTLPESAVNGDLLKKLQSLADSALVDLSSQLDSAATLFDAAAVADDSPLVEARRGEWGPVYDAAAADFRAAGAGTAGVDVDLLTTLAQQLTSLEQELARLALEKIEIERLEAERVERLQRLRETWSEQTAVRVRKAEDLMNRLRPSAERTPLVVIRVEHQGDRSSLLRELNDCLRDRRRLTDDDLKAVVTKIAALEPAEAEADKTPLERFVAHVRGHSSVITAALNERRAEALFQVFDESLLRKLETKRLQDSVSYLVYRHDGTLAGPIERVSAGQQGTAILNMLLADGDEPLIIDTPEEGLDSEGVYTELVPLFRREKERRQIIVVTHNANLPVCADAEGIAAFDAAGVVPDEALKAALASVGASGAQDQVAELAPRIRWKDWEPRVRRTAENTLSLDAGAVEHLVSEISKQRKAEARLLRIPTPGKGEPLACGALDIPVVQRAVQDIMEGSREAFERRGEKYGF